MSGLLKVLDGTPRGDKPFLCKTCIHGLEMRGENNEHSIHCTFNFRLNPLVTFKVTDCNKYYSTANGSLKAMEEIAFILISKKGGREFGFERLSKLREEGKEPPNAN